MDRDDFFAAAEAARRPFPLSTGASVELPLLSYEAAMMLATFTLSAAKARDLIPTAELVPLRLTPRRALLFVVALEYRRMCIGPYREFMIGIPVRHRPRLDVPLLPALLQERLPGFGIYLTHIGVTTEVARIVGWELLGFPKFIVDVSYMDGEGERTRTVTEAGRLVFSLAVRKPRRFGMSERRFSVYSLSPADGQLYTVPYGYRMRAGMRLGRDAARLRLGRHPLADELLDLDVSPLPLAVRYAPEFSLITQVPARPAPVPGWADPRYLYRRAQANVTQGRGTVAGVATDGTSCRTDP